MVRLAGLLVVSKALLDRDGSMLAMTAAQCSWVGPARCGEGDRLAGLGGGR
jgi:hypothetical protein